MLFLGFRFYISTNMEKRVDSVLIFNEIYNCVAVCKHKLSWDETAGNVAEYRLKVFIKLLFISCF